MDDGTFTIGELARRSGLRPSTIRYYESVGVLPPPERVAGRRHYTEDAERRLRVVAHAKGAGFSLDEVRDLLAGGELSALARRKLPEVEATIEQAQSRRRWLLAASECRCPTLDDCPLL